MNWKRCIGALTLVAASAAVLDASGAEPARRVDIGKREYDSNCASCHGPQGKGDGVVKPYLTKSPPALTRLASRNGGVFPIERTYETIDGRRDVAGHGSRDMPVWGMDYSIQAAEYYGDALYDQEFYVRARILALIDYLYRLQER
jgi:mono/diheme cytochrome c family protein